MVGYLIGYMIIYKQWVLPSLASPRSSVRYFSFDLPADWVGGSPSQKPRCEFIHVHGSHPLPFLFLEELSLIYAFIYLLVYFLFAFLIGLLTCHFSPIFSVTVSLSNSLSRILWSSGATTWWSLCHLQTAGPGPSALPLCHSFLLAFLPSLIHTILPSCFFLFIRYLLLY